MPEAKWNGQTKDENMMRRERRRVTTTVRLVIGCVSLEKAAPPRFAGESTPSGLPPGDPWAPRSRRNDL